MGRLESGPSRFLRMIEPIVWLDWPPSHHSFLLSYSILVFECSNLCLPVLIFIKVSGKLIKLNAPELWRRDWPPDPPNPRSEETIQSGKVTESFVPFYGKDQIMPSQMEVAPPDAVSGLDCWIILYLRLHLLQEHCWCCAEKKKTRRRCLLEMVENRTPHLTQPILRG